MENVKSEKKSQVGVRESVRNRRESGGFLFLGFYNADKDRVKIISFILTDMAQGLQNGWHTRTV